MTIRYDEKGKFFTNVISKQPIPVLVQTILHRIEGEMYARVDERMKDAVNKNDQFVAVTNATVFSLQGKELAKANFLLVNRDQIVWMIPYEDQAGNR